MDRSKLFLYGTLFVFVLLAAAGYFATLTQANSPQQDTQVMVQRMDQFIHRACLISDEMDRRAAASSAQAPQFQRVKRLSESVKSMATDVKTVMEASQLLLQSKEFTADQEFNRDLLGVRAEVGHVANYMENMLQYLEHLTYRIDKMTS